MTKTKIFILALVAILVLFAATVYAQPGSPADPMVSRSYLNSRIAGLEAQINQLTTLINNMEGTGSQFYPVQREIFTVVRAEAGELLIGEASTEIILRSGQATAVTGYNGIVNATAGRDLMDGQVVPHNNLLIVPQPDGRGMRFQTTSYLMIKGDFHIIR